MNLWYKFILSIYNFNYKILLYLIDKDKDGKISDDEWLEASKLIIKGLKIITDKLKSLKKK